MRLGLPDHSVPMQTAEGNPFVAHRRCRFGGLIEEVQEESYARPLELGGSLMHLIGYQVGAAFAWWNTRYLTMLSAQIASFMRKELRQ